FMSPVGSVRHHLVVVPAVPYFPPTRNCWSEAQFHYLAPSSSGLGHHPLNLGVARAFGSRTCRSPHLSRTVLAWLRAKNHELETRVVIHGTKAQENAVRSGTASATSRTVEAAHKGVLALVAYGSKVVSFCARVRCACLVIG